MMCPASTGNFSTAIRTSLPAARLDRRGTFGAILAEPRSSCMSPARGAPYAPRVLELLGIGAVAFGVGLSGALSPGPLTVLAIREAPRRGWWAGPLATLGHGVVELALVVALALGLAAYVEEGVGTAVIGLVGGATLVWMGVALARSASGASLDDEMAAAGVERRGAAATSVGTHPRPDLRALLTVAPLGALVSVVNPYWMLWWATVGTKLTVDSLDAGWAGPGAVFVGHILSDLVWLTSVAFLVGSGSRWLVGRGYRVVLVVCALFLVGIGLYFAGSAAASIA
ncbi:MAG: lysine transporter LysE [Dehalococcoidia bacterium]|nr:lysine transporter LysE [Dehalococcoidia bacterium]